MRIKWYSPLGNRIEKSKPRNIVSIGHPSLGFLFIAFHVRRYENVRFVLFLNFSCHVWMKYDTNIVVYQINVGICFKNFKYTKDLKSFIYFQICRLQ